MYFLQVKMNVIINGSLELSTELQTTINVLKFMTTLLGWMLKKLVG